MDGGEIGSSIDLSLYLQGRTLKGYAVRIYLHMYFSILFIYCQSKEREREGRRKVAAAWGRRKKKDYESRARRTTTGGIYENLFLSFPFLFFYFGRNENKEAAWRAVFGRAKVIRDVPPFTLFYSGTSQRGREREKSSRVVN